MIPVDIINLPLDVNTTTNTYCMQIMEEFSSSTTYTKDFHQQVYSSIEAAFNVILQKELTGKITIEPLKLGYSPAKKYKILVNGEVHYVLRVLDHERKNNTERANEMEFQRLASETKTGPTIYYGDNHVILMDFLSVGDFSAEEFKNPENLQHITQSLYNLHQANGSALCEQKDWLKRIENEENKVRDNNVVLPSCYKEAREIITRVWEVSKHYPRSPVHNEPDFSHIFKDSTTQLYRFVDFGESSVTDPFYDLGYLAIKLGLNEKERKSLLFAYKPHASVEDQAHFELMYQTALFMIAVRAFPWTEVSDDKAIEDYMKTCPSDFITYIKGDLDLSVRANLAIFASSALKTFLHNTSKKEFKEALKTVESSQKPMPLDALKV